MCHHIKVIKFDECHRLVMDEIYNLSLVNQFGN